MKKYLAELQTLVKTNIRDYGMYIALIVIVMYFNWATNGIFMSARNISNLINATGYIAVLAVGMTLIIVIRHIDLSVGFFAGFVGAVVTTLMITYGMHMAVAIPVVLLMGLAVGILNGLFVAKLGMPAFVVSLAGMLIFRGAIMQVITGTVMIPNDGFNAIGNGFIYDAVGAVIPVANFHVTTLVLGGVAIVLFILSEMRTRRARLQYHFEIISKPMFIIKLLLVSGVIAYVSYTLSSFNGLSWTMLIVIAVVAVYHFVTTKTILGRHIYAIGSNPEAAKLSGINVTKITLVVFGSMGTLSALSGVLYASRLQSATVTAGTLFELDAIAAAYVGGVSSAGGLGKVTGSIIGALVMASLTNGMNLMGIGLSYQFMVRGGVLLGAVAFDVLSRNRAK